MCLGPACGAGQVHKGGKEQPMMICNSCEFKICTYHGRPWHEGQTCAQFDADPAQIGRLEEEEATAKLLANDSRICPNCQQGVSKQFGCDHMACMFFLSLHGSDFTNCPRSMWKSLVFCL